MRYKSTAFGRASFQRSGVLSIQNVAASFVLGQTLGDHVTSITEWREPVALNALNRGYLT
jgi:hypothetical protein